MSDEKKQAIAIGGPRNGQIIAAINTKVRVPVIRHTEPIDATDMPTSYVETEHFVYRWEPELVVFADNSAPIAAWVEDNMSLRQAIHHVFSYFYRQSNERN